MHVSDNLTYKKIFIFWIPLALTWFMMTVEQPYLMAVIARLGEAKYNLAAFGIAYSFALIIEAPVIMLMSASTALVKNKDAYLKLRQFTFILNVSVTSIMIVGLTPPVFYFITEDVIGLPGHIARLTHLTSIIMIPWAGAIGYRRFYQGILIRNNLTRRVTYGTVIRLVFMSATALIGYITGLKGAYTAAIALVMGVVCEAGASRIMAQKSVKSLLEESDTAESERTSLSYKFILSFYTPLALTSVISLGVHPIATFFMGRSRLAIESLAVLPVVNALVFIFRSIGLSYQEVNIALIGEKNQNYKMLKNFAVILGVGVLLGLSVMAFSPLARVWFRNVSGLTRELSRLSYLPLKILVLLPVLTVWISFQRGILVHARDTKPITFATAIELITITIILYVTVFYIRIPGVVGAACAYLIGKLLANLYLVPKQMQAARIRTNMHTINFGRLKQ
jgi:hypothetical protein